MNRVDSEMTTITMLLVFTILARHHWQSVGITRIEFYFQLAKTWEKIKCLKRDSFMLHRRWGCDETALRRLLPQGLDRLPRPCHVRQVSVTSHRSLSQAAPVEPFLILDWTLCGKQIVICSWSKTAWTFTPISLHSCCIRALSLPYFLRMQEFVMLLCRWYQIKVYWHVLASFLSDCTT